MAQTHCNFCGTELEKNVMVLGLWGIPEIAPLYCLNHGTGYNKKQEKRLRARIALRKSFL